MYAKQTKTQFDTITARTGSARISGGKKKGEFVPRGQRYHTTVGLGRGEFALVHNSLYNRGVLGRIARFMYRVENYFKSN